MEPTKSVPNSVSEIYRRDSGLLSLPRVGDLVKGMVLDRNARLLLVDLGKFGTGVVYRGELKNAWHTVKNLKKGDEVSGKVIDMDNEDGYIELSLAEAGKQKAWAEILELAEKDEPFSVMLKGANKGGLTAEIAGLSAFLPVSQLSQEHYPKVTGDDKAQITSALEKLIGTEVVVKIIDANPRTEKLILSEREATELSSKELVKNYEIGQTIEGIVSGVADFGVFVQFTDNPSVEGLIHVSELAHRLVENPKEILKIDDVVKAKIIDIKDGRISLSLKALKENPWETVEKRYTVGQEVSGKVYSFNPYGAVVSLDSEIQGQIHVTEFGGVEEMRKQLGIGKEYEFIVGEMKPEEKRIILKLKK
jgi:small subunit ribosomal protein S1